MTKCYDGKNAKTNACGSGIQAPLVATPTPFYKVVKNFMNLHSNPFTAPPHLAVPFLRPWRSIDVQGCILGFQPQKLLAKSKRFFANLENVF